MWNFLFLFSFSDLVNNSEVEASAPYFFSPVVWLDPLFLLVVTGYHSSPWW